MDSRKNSPATPPPGKNAKTPKGGREERLAAALRENLRRRKAQQRGRSAPLKAIKNDDPI